MADSGLRIEIRGTVQGVGYRPWVYQLAQRLGIAGRVWNHSEGVTIDAFGRQDVLAQFVAALSSDAPPAARVAGVSCSDLPFEGAREFTIEPSVASTERRVSIPPDLATCDDCLGEVLDPANRRHRYAFTNCTNCGPRYSIVHDAPYDRAQTSMAKFPMCAACQREYDSPIDRRFHAQPNACPACGPRLTATTPIGEPIRTSDPIHFAARAIGAGLVVAIKGIGGFHLACDATSPNAVRRLRERKHRDTKPFAIMVRDLDEAEAHASLTEADRLLLTSAERPIVLVRSRTAPAGVKPIARTAYVASDDDAAGVIGLFLPYTPLHHLLVRDARVPVVMTSGNRSDEPMVTTNADALEQLGEIADVFLLHDRDIVTRVDDSIVRVIADAPVTLRRARGFVPRPIESTVAFSEPILACGAQLKNTFCIAAGNQAFPGPHIGDLDSVATLYAYETAIDRMQKFLGITPKVIAHDLHPDYLSTRHALAPREGVVTIGVQHHHAHVASVMAEHALREPVIGVAYDGTGYGTDGTSWGGEVLLATYGDFQRIATFRPMALPGGEAAIRNPWRVALALLDEAFGGEPPLDALALFAALPRTDIETVRRMVATGVNTVQARGVGRLFDAVGALGLAMPRARYEGEIAFCWNVAAQENERGLYPVVIRDGHEPWEIDARPIVRGVVEDLLAGHSAGIVSARFHNTLAAATTEVVVAALAQYGSMPVALTGGCFQNARLTESIVNALAPRARVFMNRSVPPGDGGIALGQAFVANARITSGALQQEVLACV